MLAINFKGKEEAILIDHVFQSGEHAHFEAIVQLSIFVNGKSLPIYGDVCIAESFDGANKVEIFIHIVVVTISITTGGTICIKITNNQYRCLCFNRRTDDFGGAIYAL